MPTHNLSQTKSLSPKRSSLNAVYSTLRARVWSSKYQRSFHIVSKKSDSTAGSCKMVLYHCRVLLHKYCWFEVKSTVFKTLFKLRLCLMGIMVLPMFPGICFPPTLKHTLTLTHTAGRPFSVHWAMDRFRLSGNNMTASTFNTGRVLKQPELLG